MSDDKTAGALQSVSRQDQAVAWHVKLTSDAATVEDFAAFESWVSNPANRLAFDEVDALNAVVSDNAAAFRTAFEERVSRHKPPTTARRTWIGATLAIAASILIVVVSATKPLPPAWTAYAAPVDAARQIALEDGSSVYLNRGTSMDVAVSRKSREVKLAAGEASFTVVHDASRPFSVEVGGDRIVDLGTEFNVLAMEARTVITVRRGAVAVYARGDAERAPIQLGAGDRYISQPGAAPVVLRETNADLAFAWQSGHLIYNDATLAQVVDDLNRYFDRQVRIEGDETAALRFSGVVVIDSEDIVLARLKGLLPIDVTMSGPEVVVRRKEKR